jgi:hypothetical protein
MFIEGHVNVRIAERIICQNFNNQVVVIGFAAKIDFVVSFLVLRFTIEFNQSAELI